MNSPGAKLNPQICPSNPDLVAYICNYDIWVTHTVVGSTVRLTYAHKGGRSLADDPLWAGVPSYVMQEEFSRYQGYWWQPESKGTYICVLYTYSLCLSVYLHYMYMVYVDMLQMVYIE